VLCVVYIYRYFQVLKSVYIQVLSGDSKYSVVYIYRYSQVLAGAL